MATVEKYSLPLRLIHWLMAIMILGLIFTGWYMAGLPGDAPNKFDLYGWHKSFGLTAFILLILRTLVRLTSKKPAMSPKMASWEITLAKVGHFLLYALMFTAAFSGIVMSVAGGYGLDFFFTEFQPPIEKNKELSKTASGMHEILPYVLLGVVVLHLLGVLKHKFIDKDPELDVMKKML